LIDLRDRDGLVHLAQVVADVRAHAAESQFLLVGAKARDVLLWHRYGITPPRSTTDVDMAFWVADWPTFQRLRANLLGSGRFTPAQVIHRLHSRIGTPLDIIPFGGIESATGQIAWPPAGNPVMSVLGYDAAFASSHTVLLPGDQTLAVIALPMLALLKLFTWEDRHRDQPRKDAVDLMFLLESAFQAVGMERLHDEAPGLVDAGDFDVDLASAWLLGSQARQAATHSSQRGPEILGRATDILDRETDPAGPLGLIGELRAAEPEKARLMLTAFLNGLRLIERLGDVRGTRPKATT